MPFWNKDGNYKAKLEQKLCVAKDTPEPVFDLTDCNLSEVPSGIYSMCRVFRKEVLLLQNNRLSQLRNGGSLRDLSLLRVLNLSNNKFCTLPDDIGCLSSLEVLVLENNLIRKLPSSVSNLKELRNINLRGNKLRQFPLVLCKLRRLQILDLSSNEKLKELPKELCHLKCLKTLIFDASDMIFPPAEICLDGTESVLKFLCSESGEEYIPALDLPTSDFPDNDEPAQTASPAEDSSLSATYQQYQRAKEQRKQELIQMEEIMKENDLLLGRFASDAAKRRQKLLEDVTQEQDKLEREILQIQSKKEREKQKLLNTLVDIEDHSAKLIEQLMKLNDKNCDDIRERLEQDKKEAEEMFTVKQEELEEIRKYDILESMKSMLQAEEKQREYEAQKLEAIRRLQDSALDDSDIRLKDVMSNRALDQQNLINRILEEEQFQKEAFKQLQYQRDQRHLEISYQIKLIEEELSKLTLAEVNKQDIKADIEINVLAERRTTLAHLLTELLEAQKLREMELKQRLIEMEEKRSEEMKDFWILQFEKLMDKKPPEIADAELNMDQMVKTILMEAGADLFISLFAVKSITLTELLAMTFQDLKKLGILNAALCEAIISKCEEYFPPIEQSKELEQIHDIFRETGENSDEIPQPSAPLEEEEVQDEGVSSSHLAPSAPPLSPSTETKIWCQTECVICLDSQSTAVFIPCGHVCCCWPCSSNILTCPMCREEIATKCFLTFS